MFRWCLVVVLFLALVPAGMAQVDTVASLPPWQVTATRLGTPSWGLAAIALDSSQGQVFGTGNAADWLFGAGGAYLKHYGPGRLATLGLRGSNAAHTQILWNGFVIQHPGLGQTDLSLLPLLFADEWRLEMGGSAALWGSGAIAGALQLNNQLPPPGWSGQLSGQWGSFQHRQLAVRLARRRAHWASQLRGMVLAAANNYPYTDAFGQARRLPQAEQAQQGLLWENYWQWGPWQVALHQWVQGAQRNIPPTAVQAQSVAQQWDASYRNTLDAKWFHRHQTLNLRAAWFREKLDYRDTLATIDSRSRVDSWQGEALWQFAPPGAGRWQLGGRFVAHTATNTDYQAPAQQHQQALIAQWSNAPTAQGWHWLAVLRQEWADGQLLPLLPQLRLDLPALGLRWSLQGQRHYRLPTLNDRFWSPGGNPALLPEAGWGIEGSLRRDPAPHGRGFSGEAHFYHRRLRQWIQWLPQEGGTWRPFNVQEVWNYGASALGRWTWRWQHGELSWQLQAEINPAIVKRTADPTDPAQGQQLLYAPLYQGSSQLHLRHRAWSLRYFQQWTGPVATLPDHSSRLPGYQLATLHLGWTLTRWHLSARLNNVWNTRYAAVVNRPLPGRHGQLQASWNFFNPKK